MKYTSKNQYYESPHDNQGIFENPWAETTMPNKWIDGDGELNLAINFDLKYTKEGDDVIIEKGIKIPFKEHQVTTILNENDEEEDIRTFLQGGGTYTKERIVQWGRPSAQVMEEEYLDPTTLWSGNIQLTENEPQRTIAKDWVAKHVKIHGLPIGEHFELEVEPV